MNAITAPPRFENPNPFPFTPDQYHRMGELGFFDGHRVELIWGEVIDQYPDDPVDPSPRPYRFTREQYYKLGELGFFDGHRVEFVFGEIVKMSPINWPHAQTVGLVMDTFVKAFQGQLWISVQQPLFIPGATAGAEPQPDVFCVTGSRKGFTDHPTTAALVVEVADSTLFYDITTKAELYATAGVLDYWVVDINGRQLHVFRDPVELPQGLGAFAYRDRTVLTYADSISPLAMSSATIRIVDLLP